VCDLETSRMGAPYIYDISRLRVKENLVIMGQQGAIIWIFVTHYVSSNNCFLLPVGILCRPPLKNRVYDSCIFSSKEVNRGENFSPFCF